MLGLRSSAAAHADPLTIADLLWHQAIEADPDPRASPAPPGALHEPGTSALEADSERFGVS